MSEFVSVALFLAAIAVYSWKAGRSKLWFAFVLLVLFVLLNATLFTSNCFTGDGINDAMSIP